MSATGRNLEGNERHADDFYETPEWCTIAILNRLYTKPEPPPEQILDAGSGTGAILRACGSFFSPPSSINGERPPFMLAGVEKDEGRVRQANEHEAYPDRDDFQFFAADFLNVRGWIDDEISLCERRGNKIFDLVISNPPYADAERFVEHALKIANDVVFLLRLNWLASKKRSAFHRAHPADVFVLPRRPSFTGGGTDATEYAWFVWGQGRGNRWFLLDVEDR